MAESSGGQKLPSKVASMKLVELCSELKKVEENAVCSTEFVKEIWVGDMKKFKQVLDVCTVEQAKAHAPENYTWLAISGILVYQSETVLGNQVWFMGRDKENHPVLLRKFTLEVA